MSNYRKSAVQRKRSGEGNGGIIRSSLKVKNMLKLLSGNHKATRKFRARQPINSGVFVGVVAFGAPSKAESPIREQPSSKHTTFS